MGRASVFQSFLRDTPNQSHFAPSQLTSHFGVRAPQAVARTFRAALVLLPKNAFIKELVDKSAQEFTGLLVDNFAEDFVG
jgi:hypothetical protein